MPRRPNIHRRLPPPPAGQMSPAPDELSDADRADLLAALLEMDDAEPAGPNPDADPDADVLADLLSAPPPDAVASPADFGPADAGKRRRRRFRRGQPPAGPSGAAAGTDPLDDLLDDDLETDPFADFDTVLAEDLTERLTGGEIDGPEDPDGTGGAEGLATVPDRTGDAGKGRIPPDPEETRALLRALLDAPLPPPAPLPEVQPAPQPDPAPTVVPDLPAPAASTIPDPVSTPVVPVPVQTPALATAPASAQALAPVPAPAPASTPASRRQSREVVQPATPRRSAAMDDLDRVLQVGDARPTTASKWRVRLIWAALLGLLVWIGLQPYPFEVGGDFIIQPLDRAEARARTDGEITEIFVTEGDRVEKDQVLAVLSNWDEERDVILNRADGDRLRAELETMLSGARPEEIAVAEEALRTAEVQIEIASRDLARQEALFATGTIPEKLVEEARDTLDLASAARDQARANLALVSSSARQTEIDAQLAAIARNDEEIAFAELMLEYTNIRAPAAGQIVSDLTGVPVGAYLSTGTLFAEIEDTSRVIAEIELPEITVGEIAIGAQAELRVWSAPDESIFGTVRAIAPRAEERDFGRIIRVQVEVPNPDGRLAANMTGFGKISAGELPVWQVFSRAITRFFTIELWSWTP